MNAKTGNRVMKALLAGGALLSVSGTCTVVPHSFDIVVYDRYPTYDYYYADVWVEEVYYDSWWW